MNKAQRLRPGSASKQRILNKMLNVPPLQRVTLPHVKKYSIISQGSPKIKREIQGEKEIYSDLLSRQYSDADELQQVYNQRFSMDLRRTSNQPDEPDNSSSELRYVDDHAQVSRMKANQKFQEVANMNQIVNQEKEIHRLIGALFQEKGRLIDNSKHALQKHHRSTQSSMLSSKGESEMKMYFQSISRSQKCLKEQYLAEQRKQEAQHFNQIISQQKKMNDNYHRLHRSNINMLLEQKKYQSRELNIVMNKRLSLNEFEHLMPLANQRRMKYKAKMNL